MRILLFLLLAVQTAYGQLSFGAHNHKYFKRFLEGRTIVLLSGNPKEDSIIRSVMKEKWKFSEPDYVNEPLMDESHYPKGTTLIGFFQLSCFSTFKGLCVFVPDKGNGAAMANLLALVQSDCSFYGDFSFYKECDITDVTYKLDIMVRQMVDVLTFVDEQNYRPLQAHWASIPAFIDDYNSYMRKKMPQKMPTTLLVNRSVLNENLTAGAFREFFKEKEVVFMDEEEYKKTIAKGNTKYLYLFVNHVPVISMNVYNPVTKETVYIFSRSAVGTNKKTTEMQPSYLTHMNDHFKALSK